MGILDKFKKKEDNFDNLPYLPDDPSLPPLPPMPSRRPAGQPALPPPPPRDAGPGELPELPPLPEFPREENQNLPPMPRAPPQMPPLPEEVTEALPQLEAKGMLPQLPEQAMPQRRPKVFVQLNKYKDIVDTVGKMEGRINELQNAIGKMKDIRDKENQIIESWTNLLTEAKIRIEDVNRKLPSTDGL